MKKLNVFVTALVAVALILLIVLMIKNLFTGGGKDNPRDTPGVTISPLLPSSTPPAASVTPPEGTPALAGESPSPSIPPISGERFNLESPIAHEKISITIDTDAYTHEEQDMGDVFYLSSDLSREVFIEVVLVYGDLALKKAGYLDLYMGDYTHMEESGKVLIASSSVVGDGLSLTNGKRTVDGWLIEVENGFFAVVVGYKTQEQGAEIYRMLDTVTFTK